MKRSCGRWNSRYRLADDPAKSGAKRYNHIDFTSSRLRALARDYDSQHQHFRVNLNLMRSRKGREQAAWTKSQLKIVSRSCWNYMMPCKHCTHFHAVPNFAGYFAGHCNLPFMILRVCCNAR
jgi:hypothetical protein